MEPMGLVLLFAVLFVLAVFSLFWHFSRSATVLERWAARNRFRLIEQGYRSLLQGPFFLTGSKGQAVYRVTVEDEHGRRRSGWVRCGS